MTTTSTELAAPAATGLSIFDSGTFEQMGMIASKLAQSSLIPESLRCEKVGREWKPLPPEQVAANCFRIVEQAQRWGMSPFAVVDCASVVHGKLMWEGKLVAAALEATMGIRLDYDYTDSGTSRKVVVSGSYPDEDKVRSVEGSVEKWKTDQWKASDFDQRLAYRGAREWARRHAPGVILGVYAPDEIDEDEMRNVTPRTAGVTVREETLNPTDAIDQTPATESEEPPVASNPPDPNPVTKPPEGRQKKARHERDCAFVNIAGRKTGNGQSFWVVTLNIGAKNVDMTTFSESLAADLALVEKDAPIKITFTQGSRGGEFQLEDYKLLEGGLI